MTAVDGTGLSAIEELAEELRAKGRTLVICGAPAQPAGAMRKAEFHERLGDENICASVQAALDRAAAIVRPMRERSAQNSASIGTNAAEPVTADRRQPRRRHAAAVRAVGRAAELARRDARLQIRRHAVGGLREDAIARARPAAPDRHRAAAPASAASGTRSRSRRSVSTTRARSCGRQLLVGLFADLRRIQAQPDRLARWRCPTTCARIPRCSRRAAVCCRVTVQWTVICWPSMCLRMRS